MSLADRIDPRASALVLVDYQERLMPVIDGGPQVVSQALRLAEAAHLLGVAVVGTEQNPRRLGPIAAGLRERCASVVAKMEFDACEGGLLDAVRGAGAPRQLVIGGCEAHVCVLQTALGLLRAGHAVFVVEAACGSRNAADLALAMNRLRQAGVAVVSPEMVMFEWLGSSRNERFGEVLELIKRPA